MDGGNTRANDRILVLQVMEGKKPLDSNGVIDPRLFKRDNNLHVIMDNQGCLWRLAFDEGMLPMSLRQKFTSFNRAKRAVEDYYHKRNVQIKEVID